jgi:glycosyltransferase involved in cell wall biosynthesis
VNYNRALSHFVVDRKLDALYAHEVWPAGASANLQSRLHDVASVVVAYGESYGTTPEHRRWARSMPDILKNADHVVASSEHCLDGAVRFGANRSQSSVVYAGVDVDRFRPDIECASWREAHNIAPDAFVVSVLGLVLQRKIEVFLDAISKTESDNLVFLIGGRGPDEAYVRNRLQGKNSDKVFPLGFVEEERLPEFYSASDVLVVSPNTELECMGQSMKEAMACGTPVIGAEIGGVPEAIEDGITGLMYDPNSPLALARAIDLLAESVDLRQQISAQSRDIAIERFDARVSATKTLNAIRTAIEHRKARK